MRDEVETEVAAAFGGTRIPTEHSPGLLEAEEAAVAPVADPGPQRTPFGIFFWICIGWLALLGFVTVFASVRLFGWRILPFQNPNASDFGLGLTQTGNLGPSWHHWLGTDDLSRDILARLVYGARASLLIGLGGTAIGIGVGGTLGMLSAYVRGRLDATLSFLMYTGLAFPAIIAVIAVLDFWGRAEWHIILVLGIVSIPLIYRLIRAATLSTATKEYITAAKCQGATSFRVLSHDIFPNVASSLIAYAIFTLGGLIAVEGALAFLGLSVPLPTSTWGNMIAEAGGDVSAPLVFMLAPAIALFLTLVALYYVGERVRVHFDPSEGKL